MKPFDRENARKQVPARRRRLIFPPWVLNSAMVARARPCRSGLMVVDDSIVARSIFQTMLAPFADFHIVATASTADQALARLAETPVDIVPARSRHARHGRAHRAAGDHPAWRRRAAVLVVSASAGEGGGRLCARADAGCRRYAGEAARGGRSATSSASSWSKKTAPHRVRWRAFAACRDARTRGACRCRRNPRPAGRAGAAGRGRPDRLYRDRRLDGAGSMPCRPSSMPCRPAATPRSSSPSICRHRSWAISPHR